MESRRFNIAPNFEQNGLNTCLKDIYLFQQMGYGLVICFQHMFPCIPLQFVRFVFSGFLHFLLQFLDAIHDTSAVARQKEVCARAHVGLRSRDFKQTIKVVRAPIPWNT